MYVGGGMTPLIKLVLLLGLGLFLLIAVPFIRLMCGDGKAAEIDLYEIERWDSEISAPDFEGYKHRL
jgi:hypothetical protein